MENLKFKEKIELVSGHNSMETNEIARLGVKKITMADGPHGLRKQLGDSLSGINKSEVATSFPTAATVASSWNPKALSLMGEAIAREAKHYQVNLLLGPGVNIKRNPLCGRNFEYYSEDPFLAGTLGTAFVKGVQKEGVGACVKHFALNNSENFRYMGNSIADKRTMHEIYLRPFEMIVKEAQPKALMCAYNKVNGVYCSENKWLLTEMLRQNWGFRGLTMTDWGATNDRVLGLKAGMDLEMPGDTEYCKKAIATKLKEDDIALERAAQNVLKLSQEFKEENFKADFSLHHELAYDLAIESAVLLKNEGILPLKKNDKYLIVGELFEKMRYQGAGSSLVNPQKVVSSLEAFDAEEITYRYIKGYKTNETKINEGLIREAVNISEIYDKVIIFAGLTDAVETEGKDRENYQLPANQLALINALLQFHKNIVVVLFGGAPYELSFAPAVKAILNMYLPGENGGKAVVDLLFGHKNPSGKLAETWPLVYEDVPSSKTFGKYINEKYYESIYVGYRYYDTFDVPVRYPFGYGLSYTNFYYSNLKLEKSDKLITASFTLTNTGKYAGKEVVELYVKNNENTKIFKAKRELKAFKKVFLNRNESKEITLSFNLDSLAYYDCQKADFILENGLYEVQIGAALNDIRLKANLEVREGSEPLTVYDEAIVKAYRNFKFDDSVFAKLVGYKMPLERATLPLTLESRIVDFKQTFFGRIIYRKMFKLVTKKEKAALKLPQGEERERELKGILFMREAIDNNCLRSIAMTTSYLPYQVAEGLVEVANGHPLRGLRKVLKK